MKIYDEGIWRQWFKVIFSGPAGGIETHFGLMLFNYYYKSRWFWIVISWRPYLMVRWIWGMFETTINTKINLSASILAQRQSKCFNDAGMRINRCQWNRKRRRWCRRGCCGKLWVNGPWSGLIFSVGEGNDSKLPPYCWNTWLIKSGLGYDRLGSNMRGDHEMAKSVAREALRVIWTLPLRRIT